MFDVVWPFYRRFFANAQPVVGSMVKFVFGAVNATICYEVSEKILQSCLESTSASGQRLENSVQTSCMRNGFCAPPTVVS